MGNIYLTKTPWQEALHLFLDACRDRFPLPSEEIPVEESLDRITTADVKARISSPHYDGAAMDGVAVRAKDTIGADPSAPKRLMLNKQAWWVDTGAPLPRDCDAVIQIESIHQPDQDTIEIYSSVAPGRDVRRTGEDIGEGTCLLRENHRVGPYQIGAMLAGGVTAVSVRRRARVGILPTGSDLVEPGTALRPGNIIEYNSRVAAALVSRWGGKAFRHPSAPDEENAVRQGLLSLVDESDAVILIAGSSAGRRDLAADIIAGLGEVLVHGVNIMPGKPAILGRIKGRPVIGLPGYPVSAAIVMEMFARPIIYALHGVTLPERSRTTARLSHRLYSKLGMEEFVRVRVSRQDGTVMATPLPRGAGLINSLAKADGFLRIPADTEGLEAGTQIEIELLEDFGNCKDEFLG